MEYLIFKEVQEGLKRSVETLVGNPPRVPGYGWIVDKLAMVVSFDPSISDLLGLEHIGDLGYLRTKDETILHVNGVKTQYQTMSFFEELTKRTVELCPSVNSAGVTCIGNGAASQLYEGLVRSGIGRMNLIDKDRVELKNLARQGWTIHDLNKSKVNVSRKRFLSINPFLDLLALYCDVCDFSEEGLKSLIGNDQAIIVAIDEERGKSFINKATYPLGKPTIYLGLWEKAHAGEMVVVLPGKTPCYRCIMESRFEGLGPDEVPHGGKAQLGLIGDCHFLDALALKIALAFCTSDMDMRKRWEDHLVNNCLVLAKQDPGFQGFDGEDLFAEAFGDNPAFFSYETLWLNPHAWRDPNCPVCGDRAS
ncbi:MAG: ThiF family adenylyltransferase [Deltaproteobacteria bacterium]|nr:ThiF family adenylyltransferase [Deltaproteobacteria bacterium]